MQLKLELSNLKDTEKAIRKELIKQTNRAIKNSVEDIRKEVKLLTKSLMEESKFFNDILSGDLAGHFGIPAAEITGVVSTIIDEIVNNIELTYTPLSFLGNTVRGGLKIGIGKNGFASLLALQEGVVITKQGDRLHWLDWVLNKGDQIIVSEHDIMFKLGAGRSELAVMIPSKIANWRVPSEFAGTADDNVITRQILRNVGHYSYLVSKIVNKKIKSSLI